MNAPRPLLVAAALIAAASLTLQDAGAAHGGTYRGPGAGPADSVPPGGGGGPGGVPAGPTTGGAGSGGAVAVPGPGVPRGSGSGAPAAGAGSAASAAAGLSADVGSGPDLSEWTYWWEFNKDPYLDLKSHVFAAPPKPGDADWFLGRRKTIHVRDTMRPSDDQIQDEVVPALLNALEKETNNDIVTGALMALAKIGDPPPRFDASGLRVPAAHPPLFEVFVPFLKDSNQEIAETAAIALGVLAEEGAVPLLAALVHDTRAGRELVGSNEVNYRTRAFAAYGLGLVGSRTASEGVRARIVQELVRALEGGSGPTRDLHVACVNSLGLVPLARMQAPTAAAPPAAPAPGAPPSVTSREEQVEYLLRLFGREDLHALVRAHAPAAMARLLGDDVPPDLREKLRTDVVLALLATLERSDEETNALVQSCVLALGELGDSDADPLDVRIRAALYRVPDRVADQLTRNFSSVALGRLGGRRGSAQDWEGAMEVAHELERRLERGKSAARPWTGLGIGLLAREVAASGQPAPAELSKLLRKALEEEKNPKRLAAYAISAGILGDTDAQTILLDKLANTHDDEARGYVAVALGLVESRESLEDIQKILRESKYRPELLRQAAVALGLLGDKEMVQELVGMLGRARGLASQAAIASALGTIGDRRSIDPLVAMLADEKLTATARGFAAVALGLVADPSPLPWNASLAAGLNYRAATGTLNDDLGTGILNIL